MRTRAVTLIDDLHYGSCEFVLAVPNSWLDVTTVADLADLALEFRQNGKQLRIANKYPRLLSRYLFDRGINYFTLVPASGTLEAAPASGLRRPHRRPDRHRRHPAGQRPQDP